MAKNKTRTPKVKPFDRVMAKLGHLPSDTRIRMVGIVRASLARGMTVDEAVEQVNQAIRSATMKGLAAFKDHPSWRTLDLLFEGEEPPKDLAQRFAAACMSLTNPEQDALHEEVQAKLDDGVSPENVAHDIFDLIEHVRATRMFSQIYMPKRRERPEDQSVETYLHIISSLHVLAKTTSEVERNLATTNIWFLLSNARIFHIGGDVYTAMYHEADRYTTQEIAGLDYQPQTNVPKDVAKEETERYVHSIRRASKLVGYPETFPFDAVFLAYGYGVEVPKHTVDMKGPRSVSDATGGVLLGHLMTANGFIWGFYRVDSPRGGHFLVDHLRSPDGGWPYTLDLEPWVLPNLIQLINDHRTFIIETSLDKPTRQTFDNIQHRLGYGTGKTNPKRLPPPYYTLRLQSQVIQEKIRSYLPKKPKAAKAFRSDVRGHERCRIMRGPLPIDPKLSAKLLDRGYTLFTSNTLDVETYRRLSERGLAYKKADEWMAVLTAWVEDHQSPNDPRLPYVPAVRKLGNVKIRGKKPPSGGWTEDPAST